MTTYIDTLYDIHNAATSIFYFFLGCSLYLFVYYIVEILRNTGLEEEILDYLKIDIIALIITGIVVLITPSDEDMEIMREVPLDKIIGDYF